MMRGHVERRRTAWKPLWFDCPYYDAVRIWKEFDGRQWWQMHEWRRPDGTTWAEGWIHSTRGWNAALPTTEAAPGDAPILTADDLAYLIERLAGVNDPVGQQVRAKLSLMCPAPDHIEGDANEQA